MNGVIVINKPQEFTSFDVVAVARKVLCTKKIGHCGTLDPNATGVLPLLVGNATKAQDIITNHDKAYRAQFKLNFASDTLDVWGDVKKTDEKVFTKSDIENVMSDFLGQIMQTPPMYSAIKKDGVRLYDLARQGIEVKREARPVTIYSLELTDFDEQDQSGTIYVSCSKGTYIRQLISDIAEHLGTSAIMTSLVRTTACGFELCDAISLDALREYAENGDIEKRLMPVESLFANYSELTVSEKQSVRFYNGNPLDIERTSLCDNMPVDGTVFRVKSNSQEFLGLGIVDLTKGVLKLYKHFEK